MVSQCFILLQADKVIVIFSGASFFNGNWTEWSAIWAEIICMISKLNERAPRVRFEITSMISDQNCTTRGSITTLLHPFWNRPNTGLGQFKHFIDAVLSQSENSSISWGEKVRVLETKVAKFATWYSLSFIFSAIWSAIWSVKQALKYDWLFVFSVASSLAGKKMWFKAKNSAICE